MKLKNVPLDIIERNDIVLPALIFILLTAAMIASLFGFLPLGDSLFDISEFVYSMTLAPMAKDIVGSLDVNDDLKSIAYTDTLTHLRNRRGLQSDIDQLMAKDFHTDGRIALLLLDLDRFKFINDTLGHGAGDQILKNLAGRLTDICDQEKTCYRLGGDEFVIIWKNGPSFMEIENFCHQLKAHLIAPHAVSGVHVEGGGSIGITWQKPCDQNIGSLLKRADLALYKAKLDAGSAHKFFCEQMEIEHARKQELDKRLRDAIFNGKFSLSYSPIAYAQDLGVEYMGVSIEDQANGISFTTHEKELNESGLIVQFDRAVFERVLQDAKSSQRPYKMVLRFSSSQLNDPTFPKYVSNLLDENGLDGRRFIFIFDKLERLDNNTLGHNCLLELASLGVRTGSRGLDGSLNSFQMNTSSSRQYLLLEKKWSADIAHNKASCDLLGNLIRLANGIGLTVIVDGVELAEQVKHLQDFPDVLIQGLIVGKPKNSLAP